MGDRGVVRASSLRSRVIRAIDRRAFRAADLVVADTAAQCRVLRAHIRASRAPSRGLLRRRRGCAVHAGARGPRAILCSLRREADPAARARHDPRRRHAGSRGSVPNRRVRTLDAALANPPPNVRHDRWVEYGRLPDLYRSAGCALGIFGTSDKAARVIPNKAFQALATATPLVTSDTPAQRELLEDRRDALLVPPGDPEALASAIRRLASDDELRAGIGVRGRETYLERASETALGARWRELLERLTPSS